MKPRVIRSASLRNRRQVLLGGLSVAGAALFSGSSASLHGAPRLKDDPFTLGVASGYPERNGFVLWTRLAPHPLAPDGGMPPHDVPVRWEIAVDEHMRTIVRSGIAHASPDWAHSVHVDVDGLQSGRPYWYRFVADGIRSPVGRSWTANAPDSPLQRMRLALACCQQYEHGYYTAYQHIVQDAPDLIVHVGDYIYELSWGDQHVRSHGAGECQTLADYRLRHALYRTDPDLQAAHAYCPWLLTWDDHEVDNNYGGDVSEQNDPPELFRARRAAAYRAYYEHLPLPRHMAPAGPNMRLYTDRAYGGLVNIYLLDERQYRQEHGTMLGPQQETWLDTRLAAGQARWNLLAQGVVMTHLNALPEPRQNFWNDGWNGYPAARQRLLRSLADHQVRNSLILGGDIHGFIASDINQAPERLDTPVVASELVTTSITSQSPPEDFFRTAAAMNSNVRFASGAYHGYVRLDLTAQHLRADLIGMETVGKPVSASRIVRSFAIETGRRGLTSA